MFPLCSDFGAQVFDLQPFSPAGGSAVCDAQAIFPVSIETLPVSEQVTISFWEIGGASRRNFPLWKEVSDVSNVSEALKISKVSMGFPAEGQRPTTDGGGGFSRKRLTTND
jgi:hypothetical protein